MENINEVYKTVELPCSVPGVGYTLKHRSCVEELIRYYCKKAIGKRDGNGVEFTKQDYTVMLNRAKCHDMDKVMVSLVYPQLTADYFHRLFNGHHEESMIEVEYKSKYDWMEMIFDMESAHYTKADKQGGNAYLFASTYKPHIFAYLQPYFQLFNLVEPTTIEEIKMAVNHKYYETDLMTAITQYLHTTHLHLLDGISRIDDIGYMTQYNAPVPLRHPCTQHKGGTQHQRPNQMSQMSRSVLSREMVHGTFEAQLFDYDKICAIPVADLSKWNNKALGCVQELGKNRNQR